MRISARRIRIRGEARIIVGHLGDITEQKRVEQSSFKRANRALRTVGECSQLLARRR